MGFTTIVRLVDKKKHCEALCCLRFGESLNIGINHIGSSFYDVWLYCCSLLSVGTTNLLDVPNASGGCLFLLIKE
jgi:hypothetical protein